jgi:hypothetical protein
MSLAGARAPSDLACEIQRRGWVVIRQALEPSTVQALCDELCEELREPSVPTPFIHQPSFPWMLLNFAVVESSVHCCDCL